MFLESKDEIIDILETKHRNENSSLKSNETDNDLIGEKIYLSCTSEQQDKDSTNWTEDTDQVWTLLAANIEKGKFFATPPTYNAFRLDKKHWLETNPVPWKIINKSNAKCVKWLNEQCI